MRTVFYQPTHPYTKKVQSALGSNTVWCSHHSHSFMACEARTKKNCIFCLSPSLRPRKIINSICKMNLATPTVAWQTEFVGNLYLALRRICIFESFPLEPGFRKRVTLWAECKLNLVGGGKRKEGRPYLYFTVQKGSAVGTPKGKGSCLEAFLWVLSTWLALFKWKTIIESRLVANTVRKLNSQVEASSKVRRIEETEMLNTGALYFKRNLPWMYSIFHVPTVQITPMGQEENINGIPKSLL